MMVKRQVIRRRKREAIAFLKATSDLSLSERGIFAILANLILANGGEIMGDDAAIASLIRCDVRTWRRVKERLIKHNMICVKSLAKCHVISLQIKDLAENTFSETCITPDTAKVPDLRRIPGHPDQRMAFYAAWIKDLTRPLPPSVIPVEVAQALLDMRDDSGRRLITIADLKKRGIAP